MNKLLLAALALLSPLVARANDITPKFGHYEGLVTNPDHVRHRKIYLDLTDGVNIFERLDLHIHGVDSHKPIVVYHGSFHFKQTDAYRAEWVGMGQWKTNQKVVGDVTERGGVFTPDKNIHYTWTAHWVRDLPPSPTPTPIVGR